MSTVRIKASSDYDVIIERGILKDTGKLLRAAASPKKTAVITDDRVDELYGAVVEESLREAGFEVIK